MAQAYYTLDEAAQMLAMSTDELKQMARKGQIRSFQDRGTWRFRVQDIQELARQRGMGTEPDMVLGDALAPPPPPPEPPAPRSPVSKGREEVFDFSLDLDEDHVGVGHEDLGAPPTGSRRAESKKSELRSPLPKPGSDSDVRLVADSAAPADPKSSASDMKLVQDAPAARASKLGPRGKTGMAGQPSSGPRSSKMESPRSSKMDAPRSSKMEAPRSSKMEAPPRSSKMDAPRSSKIDLTQRPSKLAGPPRRTGLPAGDPLDSGVRLVPLESDSDVKIVGADSADVPIGQQPPMSAADSDIRLQQPHGNPLAGSDEGMLTEEINLDEELQKGTPAQPRSKMQPRPPAGPEFPTASPFELSEADISLPESAADLPGGSSDFDLATGGSSDFELTPAGESSSPLDPGSSDEFNLELPDDADVALGDLPPADDLKGPGSGIRLENPVDSGISLEEGGSSDEIEFELSLDGPEATPRPASSSNQADSESEFELSLDADGETGPSAHGDSSEFELTLDDSGGLAPLEDSSSGSSDDKDIFETDFEVPALEEESGSQAIALDESVEGEVESSDFDLTLGGDEDVAVDESGSQVVALEEGEDFGGGATDAEGFGELEGEAEPEAEEEEEEPAVYEKSLPTAPWGVLPVVFMLPCVIVLFLVGIMGFELVQSMVGHKPPGMVTRAIGGMLGQNLKQ